MDALIDLSWRAFPALVMMAFGTAILVWGTRKALYGLRLSLESHPDKMQTFVMGFRIAVIGVALAGIGMAWNWHILWLFVLSLVFAGEEILESTTHLYILRRWPKKANVGTSSLSARN